VAALSLFIGKASKMSGALFDSFSCLLWYAKLAVHMSITFQCNLANRWSFSFLFYPQSSRRAAYFLLNKKLFDLDG
jgi:hypothetical protein